MKQSLLNEAVFKNLHLPTLREILATVATFISRFNVLPANISPLGSVGFFGNPFLFAISILAFDFVFKGIYPGFLFTYLGFAFYPLLGWIARRNQSANQNTYKQILALPLASLLFFLFSNFGVWVYWYEHTWQQLIVCYTLAVPFYARTLMGDLTFGYGYIAYKNRNDIKKISKQYFGLLKNVVALALAK